MLTLRARIDRLLINGAAGCVAGMARQHPRLKAMLRRLEVARNIAYGDGHEHRLDVYRPRERDRPMPVALYVHGGGFRQLSKDTHWAAAAILASRGFVVFNINYRLAPEHPFPAALQDVCAGALWVARHAQQWGGDENGLVVAGESAGANLVTALTLATCSRRDAPFARRVFDAGVHIRAVLPACGLHQVSDMGRFARQDPSLRPMIRSRMERLSRDYVGDPSAPGSELADPLLVLENAPRLSRPLPPFMLTCGARDWIVEDTRRLASATSRLGATTLTKLYAGQGHAFHFALWRQAAQRCWRDQLAFVERHVASSPR